MADREPGIVSPSRAGVRGRLRYAPQIAREQDTARLLQLIADMARDLVGADRCAIWLVDMATGEARTVASHGFDRIRIDTGQGLAGVCLRCVREGRRRSGFNGEHPGFTAVPPPARGRRSSATRRFHQPVHLFGVIVRSLLNVDMRNVRRLPADVAVRQRWTRRKLSTACRGPRV